MDINPTPDPKVFIYNSQIDWWLPIGISPTSPVVKGDLTNLKQALVKYGQLQKTDKLITIAQANQLRSSHNYYLWALGTWAIAKSGMRNDVLNLLDDLQRCYGPGAPEQRPSISSRKAFWISYCMCFVAPPATRPSWKTVANDLNLYLLGISQTHEPGYEP